MDRRVLFVAPGPIDAWASSRLRGLWPAKHIPGAQIVDITQGIIPEADVYVWIKKTHPQYLARPGVHIWDVCDPVWWFQPKEAAQIAFGVNAVVASNQGLAEDFQGWSGRPCKVIPDRLDLTHYPVRRKHGDARPVRLIWFGASQNRVALFGAVPTLERAKANGMDIELTIYDDRPDAQWSMSTEFPVYYTHWELSKENEVIAGHDIAVLPQYPGAWGAVKSNNKTLTAWACGLPVWNGVDYNALAALATSAQERQGKADLGYEAVKMLYDVKESGQEWRRLIERLTENA
jgi:glycosyltransferase involved in cell wall biosynthesis